jgi:hypothetical protein
MHHPGQTGSIGELFDGYGERPAWAMRHQAMMINCRYHLSLSEQQEPGSDRVLRWQNFLRITRGWSE